MKKSEIKKLQEIVLGEEEYHVPQGWQVVKEPTKILENNNEVFKIVIAKD